MITTCLKLPNVHKGVNSVKAPDRKRNRKNVDSDMMHCDTVTQLYSSRILSDNTICCTEHRRRHVPEGFTDTNYVLWCATSSFEAAHQMLLGADDTISIHSEPYHMGKSPRLTTVAYKYEYYDQSHFIKEFTAFTGCSPSQFLHTSTFVKQILDYQ